VAAMGLEVQSYIGADSSEYIELVSELRINTFKEFPYLYSGNLAYEKEYMQGYTADVQAMITLARVDNRLAGIATGIPLVSDSDIVKDANLAFTQNNLDSSQYYYYGEIIVLPEYQKQYIAKQLLSVQDEIIKAWDYRYSCLLTVIREDNHPQRPALYLSSDRAWERLGYIKMNLQSHYHWPTIMSDASVRECVHPMQFWKKVLV
jgi:GNAT superfamily N-acetyltransferase